MKTINYRAWDKISMKLRNVCLIDFENKLVSLDDEGTSGFIRSFDEITLLDFTGLHDIHDNPIFVGDIVRAVSIIKSYDENGKHHDYLNVIGNTFQVIKGNYAYGKWIARNIADRGYSVQDYYMPNELEIIGNNYKKVK